MLITEFIRIKTTLNVMFEIFNQIHWEEFTYGWFDPVIWIGWIAGIVFYIIYAKLNRKTKYWEDVSEQIFTEIIAIPFFAIFIFIGLIVVTADSKEWGKVIIYMACEVVWWSGIAYAVQGYC